MFPITRHQVNANWSNEMPVHTCWSGQNPELTTPNASKDVMQQERSSISGANAKWYSRLGRLLGGLLQNYTCPNHTIQPSPSLVFTKSSWKIHIHAKTWTRMFTQALVLTAKNQKQLRCLSISEWSRLVSAGKNWAIKPWIRHGGNKNHISKWKKNNLKRL